MHETREYTEIRGAPIHGAHSAHINSHFLVILPLSLIAFVRLNFHCLYNYHSSLHAADLTSCGFHKPSPSQHRLNLSSSSQQRPNSAFLSSFSQHRSNSPTFSSQRPHSSFHPSISHQHRPDVPSLSKLTLFKWTSSSGEVKKLTIIERISLSWRSVGLLIGLNMSELDTIQQKTLNDNHQSCQRVFSKWFDNNGHPSYPITWEGVQELLRDVKMETVAKDLKEALGHPAH